MDQQAFHERLHRLRWRFEYSDSKPPKYGMWDYTDGDKDPENSAWRQDKTNLLFAVIESECMHTSELTRVVECPGADFCNFAWVAEQPLTDSGVVLPVRITGIQLISRDHRTTAFRNGTTHVEARDAADKSIHFATYGR